MAVSMYQFGPFKCMLYSTIDGLIPGVRTLQKNLVSHFSTAVLYIKSCYITNMKTCKEYENI